MVTLKGTTWWTSGFAQNITKPQCDSSPSTSESCLIENPTCIIIWETPSDTQMKNAINQPKDFEYVECHHLSTSQKNGFKSSTGMEPVWFDDFLNLLFPSSLDEILGHAKRTPWPRHQLLWRSRWRQKCPPNRIPCMALAGFQAGFPVTSPDSQRIE